MAYNENKEVTYINKQLKDRYGCDNSGRVKYRLVFSDDMLEKRFGHFEDWYGKSIFIREYIGVRETKKYNHLFHQYILEKLIYSPSKEIIGSENGHYECLYAFPKGLPPIIKACVYVIHRDHNKRRVHRGVFDDEAAADKEADKKLILDYWGEESSYLQRMLNIGEAVAFSPTNTQMWDRD